jgi:ABC-type multidrug transport system fused ATPase/permease subunit
MNLTIWNNTLRYLQFVGYAILVVALPFSNFLMSFGMFWLLGVLVCSLITDGITRRPLRTRIERLMKSSNALALIALFLLPCIGLLWTTDFDYAAWDLRMKLPILALPLLFVLLEPLTQGQFRAIIGLFILAVLTAVLWCLKVYWLHEVPWEEDVRNISVFISHVRFSLLIALALGLLVRFAHNSWQGILLIAMAAIPSLYFIYIIGSVTGVIVLMALLLWLMLHQMALQKSRIMKVLFSAVVLAALIIPIYAVQRAYEAYFNVPVTDWSQLERTTAGGEEYIHHAEYPFIEDGHYVMTHIAWGELYDAWFTRSLIHPDSLDGRGHILKGTLIRYMASKGLHKDREGVAALTAEDVKAIERGVPTILDNQKRGLNKRLDRIFFEWSNYRAGGDPNGHSVLQRWEFWKTGWGIVKANVLFGVGTGDVKSAFRQAYIDNESPLQPQFRLRAHNQYLTMWITYGIVGLVLFLLILVWPLFHGYGRDANYIMFFILAALSFLTEDTLESQAGVMFFAFFYALFTTERSLSLAELVRSKSPRNRPSSDANPHK